MKTVCELQLYNSPGQQIDTYFKCHNSDGKYKLLSVESIDVRMTEQEWVYDHKCENDNKSYQGCGDINDKTFTSSSAAICQLEISYNQNGKVIGRIIKNSHLTGIEVILPSGKTVKKDAVCNDRCEMKDCEDEAQCNGFTYGQYCHLKSNVSQPIVYIHPVDFCTQDHERMCCGVSTTDDSQGCEAMAVCESPVIKCFSTLNNIIRLFPPRYNNLRNNTRCFPDKICDNARDQTNCTDQTKVGATCMIKGYPSTVSKYRICGNTPLCDDDIDSLCETISLECQVHKHQLCDGTNNCARGTDEKVSICQSMTKGTCIRRGGTGINSLPIPLAWLEDGKEDCINGDDENWPFCGVGRTQRFVADHTICSNVYLCTGQPGFVELEKLCDGTETCGNENSVCQASREKSLVETKTVSHRQGLQRHLSYCLRGLEKLGDLATPCYSEKFMYPSGDIYGLTRPLITLLDTKRRCDTLFGEQYIYTSCTGKCIDSSCPLKNVLLHDSCPEHYTDRIITIVNNDFLTFVVKANGEENIYVNDIFLCDNGYKCIPYYQVCNLIDDCGDQSDETNCTNHFQCESTGYFIPKTSKCDEKIDCLDLSDECNDECSKEILIGPILEALSWTIGISAVIANLTTISSCILSIKKCKTIVALTNKSLVILIALGDLLVGAYLLTVSVSDEFIFGSEYCKIQIAWLASNGCNIMGISSTIGSQLSLFSMTILSLIRAHGIWNSMSIPGEISPKNLVKVILVNIILITSATVISMSPILKEFEDFFINGMNYDAKMNIFIGLVNKETHFKVFEGYFGRSKRSVLSWNTIDSLVADMFSHDKGLEDFTKTRVKVGFYGNDGVCLFKYFIRETDPQKAFVWTTLAINFLCFLVISGCYVIIGVISARSTRKVLSDANIRARQRARRMNQKISIIITTDFLCWVPFILVCILHYLELLDATPWYSIFSMIILPINSIINPLLYNNFIIKHAGRLSRRTNRSISDLITSFRSRFSQSVTQGSSAAEPTRETIEMREV